MPVQLMKNFTMNYVFFPIILLHFISCESKWDPDQQFQQQAASIKFKKEEHNRKVQSDTLESLRQHESEVLLKLQLGINLYEINEILGVKYSILAQNTNNNEFWERRIYLWEDVVAAKWTFNSIQSRICQKKRDFVILTVNQNRLVSIEYL